MTTIPGDVDYAVREVPRGPAPRSRRALATAIDLATVALPLVIGWFASQYPARVYREAVLGAVMPPVCKFIGGISYARVPAQGIAPEPLAALGLLPEHDRVSQEDEFHGSYRGTAFRMVDMTLKRRTGTGKRRKVRTVFQGLVLQVAWQPALDLDACVEAALRLVDGLATSSRARARGQARRTHRARRPSSRG